MQKLKILQVVIKNTSTLDFSVPLFWHIRNKSKNAEITILFCMSNRYKILSKSEFYKREFKKIGVNELDFLHFFPSKLNRLKSILYSFFSNNDSNNNSFLDLYSSTNSSIKKISNFVYYVGQKLRRSIENKVVMSYLDIDKEMRRIKPDVILLDNRNAVDFPGDSDLFHYIFQTFKSRVVLLPHAPHYLTSDYSHVNPNPFSDCNVEDKCDIWMPFIKSDKPESSSQLYYSGYPGFDSNWIDYCKSIEPKRHKISILYVGRKFLDRGTKRPDNFNFVTMDYNNVLIHLNLIYDYLRESSVEFEFIFKAHPSSSSIMIDKALQESNMTNFTVSFDTSYSFLSYVDLVISPYSTALFSYAISGIPTIVIKSDMMDEAMSSWKSVAELYKNMSYYCNQEDIPSLMRNILSKKNGVIADVQHIRKFFPNNSLNLCYERVIDIKEKNEL
jgi:hypothetical protein